MFSFFKQIPEEHECKFIFGKPTSVLEEQAEREKLVFIYIYHKDNDPALFEYHVADHKNHQFCFTSILQDKSMCEALEAKSSYEQLTQNEKSKLKKLILPNNIEKMLAQKIREQKHDAAQARVKELTGEEPSEEEVNGFLDKLVSSMFRTQEWNAMVNEAKSQIAVRSKRTY